MLIVARTAGSPGDRQGLTLFAIPKGTAEVESVTLADGSKAARLTFDNVELDADAVVGDVDNGWAPLSRALNAGRVGAAAELIGVAAGASAMTVDYLKQRKQFGKLIGEFQALQHRAAHLYGEIEIARAAALKAAELIDAGDDRAELAVAVAKAKAADVASLSVREGVQMHGGIGMTDEHDIGLYLEARSGARGAVRRRLLPPQPGGRTQRLLRSAIEQEIEPGAGNRRPAVFLPGECLNIGDPRAEPLDRRRRERVRIRPAAHVVDGHGNGLHSHAVVLDLPPKRRERRELQQTGDGSAMEVARPPDDILAERHDGNRTLVALLDAEVQQLGVWRKGHRSALPARRVKVSPSSCIRRRRPG